jgi:hypothetical protein
MQSYDLGLVIPLSYITILPATATFKLYSELNLINICDFSMAFLVKP